MTAILARFFQHRTKVREPAVVCHIPSGHFMRARPLPEVRFGSDVELCK